MKHEIPSITATPSIETPAPPIREALGDSEIENGELQERLDEVRNWTHEFFESHYPDFPFAADKRFLEYLGAANFQNSNTEKIENLKNEAFERLSQEKSLRLREYSGLLPEKKAEIDPSLTYVFFDEFIAFVENKTSEDPENISKYCGKIGNWIRNIWHVSRITEQLELSQEINLATRSIEVPPLMEYLSPYLAYESAVRLGSTDVQEVQNIASELQALPQGRIMSIIRSLPTFAASVSFDELELPAKDNICVILERLADTDIPAIRFSALNARENVEREMTAQKNHKPAKDFIEKVAVPELEIGVGILNRRLLSDRTLPYEDYTIRKVAADAVAFYDRHSFPQHIAKVPGETLDQLEQSDDSRDWSALEKIKLSLLAHQNLTKREARKFILGISKHFFDENEPSDIDSKARLLHSISETLNEADWKTLLNDLSTIQNFEADAWNDVSALKNEYEARQKDTEESLLRRIKDILTRPASSPEDISTSEAEDLTPLLRTLDTFLETSDFENGVDYIDQWEHDSTNNSASHKAQNEISNLLKRHWKENVEKLEERFREEKQIWGVKSKVWDIGPKKERTEGTLTKLTDKQSGFKDDLLRNIQKYLKDAESSGDLFRVSLMSYDAALEDTTFKPDSKKKQNTSEKELLLRSLHTPEMKNLLGMDFSRLPLRAQVHFLLFRGKEDSAAAERFRLVLEKHPTLSDDIAYSFLATAEGSEYGETILSLAESLDTETLGPILKKYAEITKDADAVADFIRSEFPNLDETETASVAGTVTKNLLRRGRDLLVDLAKNVETDHISLLRKLDDVSAGVELYKKTFRTLYESGKLKNPAEMANTEILTLSPEDLSEKDKEWMRGLYRKSYPESEYSSSFREAIFAGLDKRLEKTGPGTRCHILRRDGKNVSFVFFEDTGTSKDGRTEKFGSSFNVEPEYRSDMVGGAFWDTFLSAEAVGSVITITGDHALPNPVSDFYVNKKGFFGIGMRTVGDRPLPLLQYDEKRNGELFTRKTGMPMTFDLGERIATDGIPDTFDKWISAERTDRNGMEKAIVRKTSEGFLLAYILPNPNDTAKNDVLLIFENPDARMKMIGSREMMRDSEAVSE